MSISFRKLGLAAGVTLLASGASASGALAANPITVSLSGSYLVVNDPTGVTQATWIETNGSGFEIIESNSANELVAGAGVTAAVWYDSNHQVFVSTNSTPITKVIVYGRGGNDAVNASTVTNVPVDLFGAEGNDILTGSPQNDVVNGGSATTPSAAAPAPTSSPVARVETRSTAATATTRSSITTVPQTPSTAATTTTSSRGTSASTRRRTSSSTSRATSSARGAAFGPRGGHPLTGYAARRGTHR